MNLVSAVFLWGLFAPLGHDQQIVPEAMAFRVRILFLKKGMAGDDVERMLGLRGRISTGHANLFGSTNVYAIGSDDTLILQYVVDSKRKKSVLREAILMRGQHIVARVPAVKRDTEKESMLKGVDPKLIKEALDALQGRRNSKKK